MEPLLQCLSTLRSAFDYGDVEENDEIHARKKWDLLQLESLGDVSTHGQPAIPNGEEARRYLDDSSFQLGLQSIVIPGVITCTCMENC